MNHPYTLLDLVIDDRFTNKEKLSIVYSNNISITTLDLVMVIRAVYIMDLLIAHKNEKTKE